MANSVPQIEFVVDRTEIHPGECVNFTWHVEHVRAVYFYAEGERWEDHGVVGHGQQQVCPPRSITYCLRVVKPDNSVEIRQIPVSVVSPAQPKTVVQFNADRTQIRAGECLNFFWHVEHVRAVYFYAEGERWDQHGVAGHGQQQVCPAQSTTYCLRVVKADNSVEIRQIPVHVKQVQPAPPPPPPPPPEPTLPEIHEFTVAPDRIPLGACVNLTWRTGGRTSWVNIVQGERFVLENAPLSGTIQDCPGSVGACTYRIIAYNPEDKRVRQDRTVTVVQK